MEIPHAERLALQVSVHPEVVGCRGTSAAWGHAAYKGKN
jgi:hypothetical protein